MILLRPTIVSLALALVLVLAASCVLQTWHMASLPDQSVEITSPEVSRIYVMRASNTSGNLRRMLVYDGEAEIGSINEDEFVCWERRPGHSRLTVYYERPKAEGGNLLTVLEIDTPAGEVSYYAVALDPENTELTIERVEREPGKAMVAERYPSQTL